MQGAALLQYPELPGALALMLVLIFSGGGFQFPGWLAQPALSCLLMAPDSYILWVQQSLVRAGFRSNRSMADFAACKIYLPLFSLLLFFMLPPYKVLAVAVALILIPDFFLRAFEVLG